MTILMKFDVSVALSFSHSSGCIDFLLDVICPPREIWFGGQFCVISCLGDYFQ